MTRWDEAGLIARSVVIGFLGRLVPMLQDATCKSFLRIGQIAQLVEQGIENPRVGSSILSLATNS